MLWRTTDPQNLASAPRDYEEQRALLANLMQLDEKRLKGRLNRQVEEHRPIGLSKDGITDEIATRVLTGDNSGGTFGGSVLPRVDLEQTVLAIFLKRFPAWDIFEKEQSNGMLHTWNAQTVAGSSTDSQLSAATEITTVNDDTATYAQKNTANIATLMTRRGNSLKEILAVQQSGMRYSPETLEIFGGTIMLQRLAQKYLLQGNFSVSSGAGASTELGANSSASFDGLRIWTSGTAPFNSPVSAVAVNLDDTTGGGPFTITAGINYTCANIQNQGGEPGLVIMSTVAKSRYMQEQEGKQRSEASTIVPGLKIPTVATVAGDLPVVGVPGAANALGTYNRSTDSRLVEDVYILDLSTIVLRYIGSPDINIFEIPMGVDGQLTRRYILFMMFGLQIADNGAFQGKLRLPV